MAEIKNLKFINLTKFLTEKLHRKLFMKAQDLSPWLSQSLQDTMLLFLLMDRLAQVKLTLWRVINTQ